MNVNKTIYILFTIAVLFLYVEKAHAKNEIYYWQAKPFQKAWKEFPNDMTKNPEKVPEENDDRYLWQLKAFPRIYKQDKEAITEILHRDAVPEEINSTDNANEPTK